MRMQCPNCKTKYRVDEEKIPSKGTYTRCKTCGTRFLVQKETGSKGSETDQVPANDPILDEQREQKVVKRGKIIAACLLPFNESAIHVQFQTLLENQIIDAIKNFKQGN